MALLERYGQLLGNPNIQGLLHAIRDAEGTADPEKGYRTMFGGGQFEDFSRHPDRVVSSGGYSSAAAGAYQFMPDTWREVAGKLGLRDFSPSNQDLAALWLIEGKRGVSLDQIARDGVTPDVIHRLAPEWASLPTRAGKSHYGQPVRSLDSVLAKARSRGGSAAGASPAGGQRQASPPAGQARLSPVDTALGEIFDSSTGALGAENLEQRSLPGFGLPQQSTRMAGQVFGPTWNAGTGPKSVFQPGTDWISTAAGLPAAPLLAGRRAEPAAQESLNPVPISSPAAMDQEPEAGSAPGGQDSRGAVPFRRSVSTSYDRGQPGLDLYFEDKEFRSLLPGRIKDIGYQGSGRGATGKGYGNYVVKESIDPATGEKVDVLYGHLDGINVKVGQEVPEGYSIGRQGGTGRVLSQDGTIASVDFLAPAPAGSGSMAPYRHFDALRRRLAQRWSS